MRSLTVTPDESYTFPDRALYLRDAVACDCAAPWTDDTTPRTDRPVRFNRGLHQYDRETPDYGRLVATYRYSPSFTYRVRHA